jgi:hypothetical protein
MSPTLNELEREARATRALIADLESLTQKFDQTLVRAEDERNLHLDKIAAEKAHLATLIDTATCIVQHLGAAVPAIVQPEEILDELFTGPYEPSEEVVAVIDSPQEPVGAILTDQASYTDWIREQHVAHDTSQAVGNVFGSADLTTNFDATGHTGEPEPTFEYVAAAVEQIAAEPPAMPDATDEPEMTDEQVERLEEQTAAALAEDATHRERELETVGGIPARRFNPFASNPFA